MSITKHVNYSFNLIERIAAKKILGFIAPAYGETFKVRYSAILVTHKNMAQKFIPK